MAAAKSQTEQKQNTDDTPTLEDLWGMPCENCSVGVLLVTLYDSDSVNERGQSLRAENQTASGGRYETQCFACGQRLSHAMNPTETESGDE